MVLRSLPALAFAGAVLAAGSANAVVIVPVAKFSGGTQYGQYSGFNAGSTTHADSFGTVGSETIADGNLKAHVWGSTTADGYGEIADATIRYYFAVISPVAADIHLTIDAAAQVSGAGSYFGEASVDLFGAEQSKSLAYARSCKAITACSGLQQPNGGGKTDLIGIANQIYTIQLTANGRVANPNSSFDAWADPTIVFTDGFDIPEGAYIQFSSNLFTPEVPAGGVPEPATWALMILGFGGAGAELRRRRTRAA